MATTIATNVLELKLNDAQIIAAVEDAFREANEALEPLFDLEFTKEKWSWPTAPSPRDIIAENILRASYKPTPGRLRYDHSWPTRYALAVHEGAKLRNGTSLPARPWTQAPLEKFEEIYAAFARTRLAGIQ